MDKRFHKSTYVIGDNEVTITLNDIKKVIVNLESNKYFFVLFDGDIEVEATKEDAFLAIKSSEQWRDIE